MWTGICIRFSCHLFTNWVLDALCTHPIHVGVVAPTVNVLMQSAHIQLICLQSEQRKMKRLENHFNLRYEWMRMKRNAFRIMFKSICGSFSLPDYFSIENSRLSVCLFTSNLHTTVIIVLARLSLSKHTLSCCKDEIDSIYNRTRIFIRCFLQDLLP